MRQAWIRVVELVLRLAALLSVTLATLWVVGYNGFGLVDLGDVPDAAHEVVTSSSTLFDWSQPPRGGALFTDREDTETLYAATVELGSIESGLAPDGWADPTLSTGIQFGDPELVQLGSWAALNAGVLLAIGWMWWTLGSLVRSGRGESPFTRRNSTRLTWIGWLLLVGGLLESVARWALLAWMTESSSLADRVSAPTYSLTASVPWGTLAVGASVLVLAHVWRRGLAMADDLEGLV